MTRSEHAPWAQWRLFYWHIALFYWSSFDLQGLAVLSRVAKPRPRPPPWLRPRVKCEWGARIRGGAMIRGGARIKQSDSDFNERGNTLAGVENRHNTRNLIVTDLILALEKMSVMRPGRTWRRGLVGQSACLVNRRSWVRIPAVPFECILLNFYR